jgi:hypothetical protein
VVCCMDDTRHVSGGADGAAFRLPRALAHSSLAMTVRYVQKQTDDLSAVHERFGPDGAQRKSPGRAKSR